MNGCERYLAAVRGEPMDVLPRLPILMAFAARFIDSHYGAFAADYRVLVEANFRCVEAFGFDQLSAISDPYRETQGFGAEIVYVRDGVPRCPSPPLAGNRDLGRLARPDPAVSERMLDRVRAVECFRERAGGRYSILGWIEGPAAEAADLRGVTDFLMDLASDRQYAGELMDLCVEAAIDFGKAQLRAGADTIGMGDAIASQVSAEMYAELILPRERRIVDALHAAGGLVRLHICGNITHLLPHVRELGADIVDLDWQVDMAEARRVLGRRTPLCGNIDPAEAVLRSTPAAIRKAVHDLYATVGNRYLVGAGCEIPVDTPTENLRALCTPVPYRAGPGG